MLTFIATVYAAAAEQHYSGTSIAASRMLTNKADALFSGSLCPSNHKLGDFPKMEGAWELVSRARLSHGGNEARPGPVLRKMVWEQEVLNAHACYILPAGHSLFTESM